MSAGDVLNPRSFSVGSALDVEVGVVLELSGLGDVAGVVLWEAASKANRAVLVGDRETNRHRSELLTLSFFAWSLPRTELYCAAVRPAGT